MEYVYAALLLHRTGKEITEDNLKKVIEATGTQADESKLKTLIASLKGVDIAKELENATIMAASPAGGAPSAEAKAEKKEEEKPSEAAEGLSALFG